jgi:hypothetical protein
MNTDPKNQERVQGLQLHPEPAVPNTHPRRLYEVTVRHIDCYESRVRVQAPSEAEAEDAAVQHVKRQKDWQWDTTEHELYAFSVEQVTEGGRHV